MYHLFNVYFYSKPYIAVQHLNIYIKTFPLCSNHVAINSRLLVDRLRYELRSKIFIIYK